MTNSLSLLGIDSIDRLLILSTRQLCLIVAQICLHYTNEFDMKPSENSIRQCSQWISGQIVSYSQHKITIFDIRAFFELKQWRSYRIFNTSSSNSANLLSRKDHSYQMLSMKTLVQTAMLLNQLKYQSKKMTFDVVEKILLENFNVDCLWIPTDITLTVMTLLYESHSREKSTKLTTSEVKKWDRLREISKVITVWLVWLLQDCRYEVILSTTNVYHLISNLYIDHYIAILLFFSRSENMF